MQLKRNPENKKKQTKKLLLQLTLLQGRSAQAPPYSADKTEIGEGFASIREKFYIFYLLLALHSYLKFIVSVNFKEDPIKLQKKREGKGRVGEVRAKYRGLHPHHCGEEKGAAHSE